MTVRRRAVLAILLGFPVGWMYVDIGWRLVFALLLRIRGDAYGGASCRSGSGLSHVIGQFNGCDTGRYRFGYASVELVLGTLLAVAIVYGLARFVTAPIRQMARSVEQLGPANLGLRLRPSGSRRDETTQLGNPVDLMLDRVAEGYEAQRRFAANASHELRTPLATQRALIEVSLSDALTPAQLSLLARQLLATNERSERLTDGLLTLAETDRGLATSGPLPLDELVADVLEVLRTSAAERDVTITADLQPCTVLGERALLERLVTNLVQNAVKYNQPGGAVQVTVADRVLTVANTGPVVPADAVDGLFEPFRRLTGERLEHGGGVGLGLTIARSIVVAHRGTIRAEPNPGGGLVVRVELR